MPPRTRTRGTRVLKENIDIVKKNKLKSDGKITKAPRKALADKTNSLSDDNVSVEDPVKITKKVLNAKSKRNAEKLRPRRERRLPPRYIENETLKNLSNNKESPDKQILVTSKAKTRIKKTVIQDKATKSQDVEITDTTDKSSVEIPDKIPKDKLTIIKATASQPSKATKTADKQVPITKYLSNNDNGQATTRSRRIQRLESAKQPLTNESKSSVSSPLKTSSTELDNSLISNRPKRIHRLPSRFEDHSISPNKFIPVQPCHASTPLQLKNTKAISDNSKNTVTTEKKITKISKITEKPGLKSKVIKTVNKGNSSNSSIEEPSPDSNNNAKNNTRPKRATVRAKLQIKKTSPKSNKITPFAKRLLDKSLSFRVLEDKGSNDKDDVYEFTFDPNDEPTPQKKKRKKPAKKRPPKPKTVVLKSNYDDNVSKALENLKNRVKPSTIESVQITDKPQNVKTTENHVNTKTQGKTIDNQVKTNQNPIEPSENQAIVDNHVKPIENVQSTQNTIETTNNQPQSNCSANLTPAMPINDTAASIHATNYASIRVEDIAADFELSQHDINYSPVNSLHPQQYEAPRTPQQSNSVINSDPLNLHEGTSFFEEPPVASSSMNISVRQPLASPWRVEFGSLPMKWHNNTYVKPNMTPAVECSFINSEQSSKKKHVYTNMLTDEPLPEIFNPTPALKQTSIISFIKEVVDKQNKKKRRRTPSPVKTNSIFEDISNTTASEFGHKTPKKAKTAKDSTPNTSNNSNVSKDKENSANSSNKSLSPQKRQKKKDKDCTFFGFDESENLDQENVAPQKQNKTLKTRNLRSRNILQEMNTQPLPTRIGLPVNPKSKLPSSELVEQMYDQLKSTEDAQFPTNENAKEPNTVATDVEGPSTFEDNDSQSVHLFEDIEVVHHMKPYRKSYGKAKKVTFIQPADSDSDSQQPVPVDPERSSDEDDLADLTFQIPDVKQKPAKKKKAKNKKLLTKKEEKEADEWAAGFNSMCEDIDDFPLVVE